MESSQSQSQQTPVEDDIPKVPGDGEEEDEDDNMGEEELEAGKQILDTTTDDEGGNINPSVTKECNATKAHDPKVIVPQSPLSSLAKKLASLGTTQTPNGQKSSIEKSTGEPSTDSTHLQASGSGSGSSTLVGGGFRQ
jgi:hypothetical protein